MLCYLIEERPLQATSDESMRVYSDEPEAIDETLDPLEILIAREELALAS